MRFAPAAFVALGITVAIAGARAEEPPAPRTPPSRTGLLAGAITAAAVSLALVATGAALYSTAVGGHDQLKVSCAPRCDPAAWSGYQAESRAGYAMWGLAGLVAVGDVVLFTYFVRTRPPPRALLLPAPAGVVVRGAF